MLIHRYVKRVMHYILRAGFTPVNYCRTIVKQSASQTTMAVLRLVRPVDRGLADNASYLIAWRWQSVDNNGNYVNLWDELICLLNFASMFIYSVIQMLACSFMVFDS